jgi:hypothetical protein
MQAAPAPAIPAKRAPISGEHEGYGFYATIQGYDISLNGQLVKIERGDQTADVRTNAQRAKQWIANQIAPALNRFA